MKKNIITVLSFFILIVVALSLLQGGMFSNNYNKLAFSDFLDKVESKEITSVTIQGMEITGVLTDNSKFITYTSNYPGLIDKLSYNNIYVDVKSPDSKMNSLFNIFVSWFPMLLLIGVWVFFMRQMQGGKGMGLGKSKAKLNSESGLKVTFADIAGIDEAKEELYEIVEFLMNPGKFKNIGGKIPKGCLLIGPPGTGKTLLARAIAGEANVQFFSISGSDFVEMFVGVGASRVRDMFEQGKRSAPCIIFIDEIDAVGRHRGVGMGGGNDEREQTLNQVLVEMDGFESNEGVIILAATNRPDVLDRALLRPGRFDRLIVVSNPSVIGREEILKVHMQKIKHSDNIDLKIIARGTTGFSGAKLKNLVNEAALYAARNDKEVVGMEDMEAAKDKIIMGIENKSQDTSEYEIKLTAYHEAGHALVSLYCPSSDPIYKATIIPRGDASGMVVPLPEGDTLSTNYSQMQAKIATYMAGKVAEEIIFGKEKTTSGASDDIKQATIIARAMVTEWGLSDAIGPVFRGNNNDYRYYYGRTKTRDISEHTWEVIDEEVKKILEEGHNSAKNIIQTNIKQLHILAKALIKYETLSGKQIKNLLLGNDINSKEDPEFPVKG